MLLRELADASTDVAGTASRLGKVERLASVLRALGPDEVPIAVAYLSGELPGGTIGVGWAALKDLPPPAAEPTLEVLEVQRAFEQLRSTTGPGSQAARRATLHGLFGRATEPERRFLVGLLLGELRQGALAGVMVDAVARASGVAATEIRRAAMLAGDLAPVARSALHGGGDALRDFRLTPLQPVQPMLAQTADDLASGLERTGPAAVEWKLDGARIQVHRVGGEVRAFTRSLADVTDRVPEVVAVTLALPVDAAILDGESIALRTGGRPHAFQVTMSRFGTRPAEERDRREVALTPFFFDLLHLDGDDLIDRPLHERRALLAAHIPDANRIAGIEDPSPAEAQSLMDEAIAAGHEGVMVKGLDSPYEAGRRGAAWLKVKRAHTLDLVILAAEWGHGRRRGWLSNLHLGARDPETGGFVMLGKTFKGMTDAMLAWQTERLQELATGQEGITVHVRPEVVVEVAFDGVQASTRYPGGLALRFARVKGYRPDKGPHEADTIDAVRAIHAAATMSG